MAKRILCSLLILLILSCGSKRIPVEQPTAGSTAALGTIEQRIQTHGYPKLANQLQICCGDNRSRKLLDELHYYDLGVIEADMVHRMPEYLSGHGLLRTRNPNLLILSYFSAGDVNPHYPQPIHQNFIKAMQDSWYLRDVDGNQIPFYQLFSSGWTIAQNPSSPVSEFLPEYLNQNVLRTGMVDGIFYDWAVTYISWLNHTKPPRAGPIDIDNDGKPDSDEKIDELWVEGFIKMLKQSRDTFGDRAIIMGNGGWNTGPQYANALNGVMIEQFTEGEPGNVRLFGWRSLMRTYAYYQKKAVPPRTPLIMANDDNADNLQLMRFALSSTLMFDGYFCFTNRTGAYQSNRWYDEYSVILNSGTSEKSLKYKGYLGNPSGKAYAASNPKEFLKDAVQYESYSADSKVWRRDFENGIVLVNPSQKEQKIELNATYRKIRGNQNRQFNNGSRVTSVLLPPRDGAILLKHVTSGAGQKHVDD